MPQTILPHLEYVPTKNLVFSHVATVSSTVATWLFRDVVIIHMVILPCG